MTDSVLKVEGLTAGYDGVPVVRGLNLHVEPGEVVALLGPNGAGKTTTLLTISGLLPCIAGGVRIAGDIVDHRRPHRWARKGVAHVPEDRALFFSLSVSENLKVGAKSGDAQIERVLHHFPALEPLMNRPAGLLSGGEQQMLAMGQALVSDPQLLMVDEMSLGLAPLLVARLLPILRQIADESKCAILFVEQHVHLALEVADRGYVLSHGELVLEGDANHLLENRELVEASYLGDRSLLEHDVHDRGYIDRQAFTEDGLKLK
jgi:branched-chain amino acid transport system ATP-binding protein